MNNKKSFIALLLVAIIGIVGLTLAYFSNSDTIENQFITKEYGTTYTEEFVSPDNWLPGDTTNKTIIATNTGETDEAVRIRVSESWTTNNNGTLNGWIHTDGTKSTHTSTSELETDERVAILNLANTSDWTKVGDYYYYNYKLAPGESTTSFLESVTFNSKTKLDNTCTESESNGVKTVTCNSSGDDYDNATYKLILTIETVQYNKYNDAWNLNNAVTIVERIDPAAAENYVVTETPMYLGQTLPNGVTLKNASSAKADWVDITGSEEPIYLKILLSGSNQIEESYACFEKNDTQYCITAGDTAASFSTNAKIIYDAFEGQGCKIDDTNMTDPYSASYIPNPNLYFECRDNNLDVSVWNNQAVVNYYFGGSSTFCHFSISDSSCGVATPMY